jgi:hypothetical protein
VAHYVLANPHKAIIQGGSNMTGTNCDLFTHKSSRSYLNHLVYETNTQFSHNGINIM